MTNLNGVLKSRDISLLTKVHIVRAMIFPVVMYGLESWTIMKIEHQGTDFHRMAELDKILQNTLDCKEPTYWQKP